MTNAVFPKAKEAMLNMLMATGAAKVQLIDLAAYTYSAAHAFLADIPAGARVGAPVALASITTTDGVFDAADQVYAGLVGIPSTEAAVFFVDTGDEATSRLFYYLDTATGLPIAAGSTGGTLAFSNGANKIFKL